MKLLVALITLAVALAIVSAALNLPAWLALVSGALLIAGYVRFAYEVARAL